MRFKRYEEDTICDLATDRRTDKQPEPKQYINIKLFKT